MRNHSVCEVFQAQWYLYSFVSSDSKIGQSVLGTEPQLLCYLFSPEAVSLSFFSKTKDGIVWWALVIQLCSTLHPMDCSPPGSSVHRISLARLQDWVVISFSKGSSWPGIEPRSPMCRLSLILQADSLPAEPCVKPPSGVRRLMCGICPRSCLWGHFSEESLFLILQLKY